MKSATVTPPLAALSHRVMTLLFLCLDLIPGRAVGELCSASAVGGLPLDKIRLGAAVGGICVQVYTLVPRGADFHVAVEIRLHGKSGGARVPVVRTQIDHFDFAVGY